MLTRYDKAIAGFLASALLALAHKYLGLTAVDPDIQLGLEALIVALIVGLVPNKPASK